MRIRPLGALAAPDWRARLTPRTWSGEPAGTCGDCGAVTMMGAGAGTGATAPCCVVAVGARGGKVRRL
eukprot:11878366-Heterocapsa_arctica.AAC.1